MRYSGPSPPDHRYAPLPLGRAQFITVGKGGQGSERCPEPRPLCGSGTDRPPCRGGAQGSGERPVATVFQCLSSVFNCLAQDGQPAPDCVSCAHTPRGEQHKTLRRMGWGAKKGVGKGPLSFPRARPGEGRRHPGGPKFPGSIETPRQARSDLSPPPLWPYRPPGPRHRDDLHALGAPSAGRVWRPDFLAIPSRAASADVLYLDQEGTTYMRAATQHRRSTSAEEKARLVFVQQQGSALGGRDESRRPRKAGSGRYDEQTLQGHSLRDGCPDDQRSRCSRSARSGAPGPDRLPSTRRERHTTAVTTARCGRGVGGVAGCRRIGLRGTAHAVSAVSVDAPRLAVSGDA